MKKLKKFEIGIIGSVPVFYAIGYLVFLSMAKPSTSPPVSLVSVAASPTASTGLISKNLVTIVTGNVPLGAYAVKVFRPSIDLHMKLTGKRFVIRFHELA